MTPVVVVVLDCSALVRRFLWDVVSVVTVPVWPELSSDPAWVTDKGTNCSNSTSSPVWNITVVVLQLMYCWLVSPVKTLVNFALFLGWADEIGSKNCPLEEVSVTHTVFGFDVLIESDEDGASLRCGVERTLQLSGIRDATGICWSCPSWVDKAGLQTIVLHVFVIFFTHILVTSPWYRNRCRCITRGVTGCYHPCHVQKAL